MKKLRSNLTFQVIIAILLGVLVGVLFPGFTPTAKLISQVFINMINMLIAPIIFFTLVLGIARMSDMKKLGRVGGKALIYFEIITTFALALGMIVGNIVRPGDGVDAALISASHAAAPAAGTAATPPAAAFDWMGFIAHIVPRNIFDAFATGDLLQILFFTVLFGVALSRSGSYGQPLIDTFERISKVLFKMMNYVMTVLAL